MAAVWLARIAGLGAAERAPNNLTSTLAAPRCCATSKRTGSHCRATAEKGCRGWLPLQGEAQRAWGAIERRLAA
jgi:hypothetical protein